MRKIIYILLLVFLQPIDMTPSDFIKIGRVKYSGGGDWYNDPSAEPNLLKFISEKTIIKSKPIYEFVDLASDKIYDFPILFLTGHGNINFSEKEVNNLRIYLESGGFLYIDDDYGLDEYIRKEMKKVFPEKSFVEIPSSHSIYDIYYDFKDGLPKIHEHDKKTPQLFGMFIGDRISVFYTYESNPSDGWADEDIHNVNPELRKKSLEFGLNIILWALTN